MIATYLLIAAVTALLVIGLLVIEINVQERKSYEEKYEKLMQDRKSACRERV